MLTKNEKELFAKTLQFVSKTLINKAVDSQTIEAYWFVLADEFNSIKEFQEATKKILKTWAYSYLPKPANFIEMKNNNKKQDLEIIALKAYVGCKNVAVRFGVYADFEFEDKIIHDVITFAFGSWKNFHDKVAYKDSDDTWAKKEFIKAYINFAKRGVIEYKKLDGYLTENKLIKVKCNYQVPKTEFKEIAYKKNKFFQKINQLANNVRVA